MKESQYFTQQLSLDINYSSRFIEYPHYPVACCLLRLCTVAYNCHGKRITVTSRQKEKPHGKKKKTHGKIYSMPRGHFNSFFLLPRGRGFSFCRESFSSCRDS